MNSGYLPLRLVLLACLSAIMGWAFLVPHPLPFGIAVQREIGFVGHIGIFSMVTLACGTLFPQALWWTAAVLLIAATCLEAAQLLIPKRGAEVADFAMNCVGILLGLAVLRIGPALLTRYRSKKSSQT
ncbi:MAG: VanZ family protein [Paracoccaceae bacterium]